MSCIGPVTLTDFELLAYADEEATPGVSEHLSRCSSCQVRALELAREVRALQHLLRRAGCPPALELGEYHLGLLDEASAAGLGEHLYGCPGCRAEVADLATFLARLQQAGRESVQDAIGTLRTIAGRLSTARLGGPAEVLVPVTRGVADDAGRGPVLYIAEDILVTVDSWVERAGQPGRAVAGLVVGPVSLKNAEASMTAGGMLASKVGVDALGNFLFSSVSPGLHNLLIELPATGLQIAIDGLMVE